MATRRSRCGQPVEFEADGEIERRFRENLADPSSGLTKGPGNATNTIIFGWVEPTKVFFGGRGRGGSSENDREIVQWIQGRTQWTHSIFP